MPMTRTETAWKFDELEERAKERARDWYRQGALDHEWWDSIYEDASACAALLGIYLRTKPVKLMNGSTRHDPAIYFSGFSSQGDGACFEGTYYYAKGCIQAIKRHAPQDEKLAAIARDLVDVQRRNFYQLTAVVQHRGHYYHEHCTEIDVERPDSDRGVAEGDAEAIKDALRAFMRWIYGQLEKEHDWLMADEQVDDAIRANEYEFNEDGTRY